MWLAALPRNVQLNPKDTAEARQPAKQGSAAVDLFAMD